MVQQRELRAEFARRLSALYGTEVPAYAFLPKSAAGIFQSNLTSDGHKDATQAFTEIEIPTPATATEGHLQ